MPDQILSSTVHVLMLFYLAPVPPPIASLSEFFCFALAEFFFRQASLRVLNVSLAMPSDPETYFSFLADEISQRGHTIISRHLEQFDANRIVNIHFTNSDWKPRLNLLRVFDVSLEMSGDPKMISVLAMSHEMPLPDSSIDFNFLNPENEKHKQRCMRAIH